jgi:hypothetical protein
MKAGTLAVAVAGSLLPGFGGPLFPAAALGCSETRVSWRLFAARGKLKRLLTDQVRANAAQ